MDQPEIVRVTSNLPKRIVQELKERSATKGDTLTQGMKAAITTKLFLDEKISEGAEVLVRERDGSLTRLQVP